MIKNSFGLMCLSFILGIGFSHGQQDAFAIKELPPKYQSSRVVMKNNVNSDFVDLSTYLPSGFTKKGNVDYTIYIQKGLKENRKVIFPDFPILINDNGLTIESNSELVFLQNSLLKLKPSNKERYEILRIHNVSNVKITNPMIEGDRTNHKGKSGEWGMGISIRGQAKDISISDAKIKDCWGDGIYLGHLKNIAPENISITNSIIDNCRRNGISITTGKNVIIEKVLISNIYGTAPQSGIVIEPSNSSAVFHNITLNNATVYNVGETGIKIAGFEKLLGNPQAVSNIIINHPILDDSKYNFFIGRIRDAKIIKGTSIGGEIKIINPVMLNASTNSFIIRKQSKRGPKISILGMSVENKEKGKNEAREVLIDQ